MVTDVDSGDQIAQVLGTDMGPLFALYLHLTVS